MVKTPSPVYILGIGTSINWEQLWICEEIAGPISGILKICSRKLLIYEQNPCLLVSGVFLVSPRTVLGESQKYQITPVKDDIKAQEDIRLLGDIEVDSQLGHIDFVDKLWRISRKVDFADCEEFVKVRTMHIQPQ
ncbi:unnamed protein product, partial [Meganyctiphanes norvegica]